MFQYNKNKKQKKLQFFLLIITILVFIFGIINGYHNFNISGISELEKNIFYKNIFLNFAHWNYLFISILLFMSLYQRFSKKIMIFRNLNFIALVNLLMGTFVFANILVSNQFYILSPIIKSTENGIFVLLIFYLYYFLGYIILPFLFLYYFWNNFTMMNWTKIWIVLIYPLFYFFLDFSISLIIYSIYGKKISYETIGKIFLSPYNSNFSSYDTLPKIFITFILLSLGLIAIKKIKIHTFFKISLIILFLLLFSPILFYRHHDLQHAQHLLSKPKEAGSFLFAESELLNEQISIANRPLAENDRIIELGSGVGSITNVLTKKYGCEKIIAFEIDPGSCRLLEERFKGMRVIEGDAAEKLKTLYDDEILTDKISVKGLVSSLPINLLNYDQIKKIDDIIHKIMLKTSDEKFEFREIRYSLPYENFDCEHKKHKLLELSGAIRFSRRYGFSHLLIPAEIVIYSFNKKVNSYNNDKEVRHFTSETSLPNSSSGSQPDLNTISLVGSHSLPKTNFSFLTDFKSLSDPNISNLNYSSNSLQISSAPDLATKRISSDFTSSNKSNIFSINSYLSQFFNSSNNYDSDFSKKNTFVSNDSFLDSDEKINYIDRVNLWNRINKYKLKEKKGGFDKVFNFFKKIFKKK